MKARWFKTCGVLFACATLSTMVACGDDSDGDAGVAGAGGATAGTGGSTAGTGGSTAGKSGGGGGGSMAVSCGGVACSVNSTLKLSISAASACCTAPDMKCGQYNTAMKCLLNNAPGKPDSSCPALNLNVSVGGVMMAVTQAGCCTPAGQCGNDYSTVGWGCVARADIDSAMGGPAQSVACGAGDGGADSGI